MASARTPDRPYQGYPYVNPVVIDVPSLDPVTAARWANLPRRRVNDPTTRPGPTRTRDGENTSNQTDSNEPSAESSSKVLGPKKTEETEDIPVVYIDLPDQGEGRTTVPRQTGQDNPAFEETIFFDPFENRQIDVNRIKEPSEREEARPGGSGPSTRPPQPGTSDNRPNRPAPSLLQTPGSAGQSSSTIPDFKNNESQVYGRLPSEDGFSLTPLPVNDFPEPPPAYSEISPGDPPPRTQVVVIPETQGPTVGLASTGRKTVYCQQCGLRVNTLVVRESGTFTHIVALITALLCILPVTFVVYWTNYFKYKVHYCPNCNYKIGYQLPILGYDMVYRSST